LITKTIIPPEILPIAITLSNLVNHAIGLAVLFVVLAVFGTVPITAVGLLLYLPILVLFAQGLGWIVAGLQVFLRDTIQVLQVVMSIWFWLTPVMYSADRLKEFERVAMLSPMAVVTTGYRNSLLGLSQPGGAHIVVAAVISLGIFIVGGLIFRQTKSAFADVL
jgi:lipopolysaccharide transport system permease protein